MFYQKSNSTCMHGFFSFCFILHDRLFTYAHRYIDIYIYNHRSCSHIYIYIYFFERRDEKTQQSNHIMIDGCNFSSIVGSSSGKKIN